MNAMAQKSAEELERMSEEERAKYGYFVHFFLPAEPSTTSFLTGAPSEAIRRRSAELIQKAAAARLTEELSGSCSLLLYGSMQGDPTYRIQLAKFLSERYGSPVHSNNIFSTAGASQGLNFLANHFFKKGDLVFVEDPTYFLALTTFRYDLELKVVSVAKDNSGIDTADLEKKFREHLADRSPDDTKPFRCMLYLVPCFHNPTTTCTTPERSREIVRVARKYDALVVCDDVYNVMSWIPAEADSGRTFQCPPRLFSFDDPRDSDYKGNVVSNGSVSKFLAPGLRVGWLEAPPRVIENVSKSQFLDSGGSFNHFTAGVVGTMMKMGLLGPHLDFVIDTLKFSADSMIEILKAELPAAVKISVPRGGYFIWIELPKTVDVDQLAALCKEKYKVTFAAGKHFGTRSENCIRLAFSYFPVERLQEATKKLCQAIMEVINSPAQTN